jgi:hypothetical protein
MTTDAHPHRRMLISVDMERYSRQDNETQYRSQQLFAQVMRDAADELGLDRVRWITQQGGDGEFAILPDGTLERRVVGELVFALDRLLGRENPQRAAGARVRLRVAIHEGLVHLDGANGFPGEAVVTVCRLVDAPDLKAALRAFPDANVALIVSDEIYRGVVRAYRKPRPDRFRKIDVRMPDKGFAADAWIFVPDEDAAGAGPTTEGRAGPTTEGRAGPTTEGRAGPAAEKQRFNIGSVQGQNIGIGDHHTFTTMLPPG